MSTKPPLVPAWATSGTRTQPISAKQASGFVSKERPAAQFLNWLIGILGDWAQYLSDGNFTGGVTADTLTVTGNAQLQALTTAQNITLTQTLSRNAVHKIHPTDAYLTGAVNLLIDGNSVLRLGTSGGAFGVYFPVRGECGHTLDGFNIYINKTTTNTWTFQLLKFDAGVDATTVVSTGTYSGTSGSHVISVSGLNQPLGGNFDTGLDLYYYIALTAGTEGGGSMIFFCEPIFIT